MSTDSEERITGELDAVELGLLLQEDVERAFAATEPPTVTLERDKLQELLAESIEPQYGSRPHIVPRELLKSMPRAQVQRYPWEEDLLIDTDISKSISPLVVLGVIGLLLGLFFAVMHAG